VNNPKRKGLGFFIIFILLAAILTAAYCVLTKNDPVSLINKARELFSSPKPENVFIDNTPVSESSAVETSVSITDAPSETSAHSTTPATSQSTQTSVSTTQTSVTSTTKKPSTTTTISVNAPKVPGSNNAYVYQPNYVAPYYIVVYTGSQSVVVYGKDSDGYYNKVIKSFTCSTGKASTPTRTGLYSIIRQYRWRLLMGGVYGQYSSGFSNSYLFHSVLYKKTDESTLKHASYDNLGKAASHGCVRLCVRDAKWIYENCRIGTQVHVVKASGPAGSPLPKRNTAAAYAGWDPTDPNPLSPYNTIPSTTTTTTTTTTAAATTTATTTTTASSSTSPAQTTATDSQTTTVTSVQPTTEQSAAE